MKKVIYLVVFILFVIGGYLKAEIINFNILATTDVHGNILNYNYFQDEEDNNVGINRLSYLVNAIRKENPNIVLIDNGDLIQGNPLADYLISKPIKNKNTILHVMEYMKYDAIIVGNHEFNYGLERLFSIIKDSKTPIITSNIKGIQGEDVFKPYVILEKKFISQNNVNRTVKIAVIGATTPQVMLWDYSHLNGNVQALDILESVDKYVKEVKSLGADIVIVSAHSGIGKGVGYQKLDENITYEISKIKGVDFIISGHEHNVFPNVSDNMISKYANIKGIDTSKGTINEVPTVMAGSYAKYLGNFEVSLFFDGSNYKITSVNTKLLSTNNIDNKINKIINKDHKQTVKLMNSKIGTIDDSINNHFVFVSPDFTIKIVNDAQIDYVKKLQQNQLNKYENLPVLSAMAPFKNGGRQGSSFYTSVQKGDIMLKNVADLYLYPNTLVVLKITGKELKEYLEWSAQIYADLHQNIAEQNLIDETVPSYNFDIVEGITYNINLNKNKRYKDFNIVNKSNHRIENLKYNGANIKDTDEFLIAVNNYRSSTNSILNFNNKNVIFDSQEAIQSIMVDYIKNKKDIKVMNPNNLTLILPNKGNYFFKTANNAISKNERLVFLRHDEEGFSLFKIVN